jgi:hypothetical protein
MRGSDGAFPRPSSRRCPLELRRGLQGRRADVVAIVGTVIGRRAGTADRNVDGQAIALTVFSTMRWWGRIELPLFFLYIRLRTRSLGALRKLSFIHAARWSIVYRIPYNGPPQPRRRLHHPHLYFESNFNGGWEEYIDAFSYVLRSGMWAFWGSSHGFPGALPSGPFKAYIRKNSLTASHYYSAYPQATASMALGALELTPRLAELHRAARTMTPEQFSTAWREFLTEMQSCL